MVSKDRLNRTIDLYFPTKEMLDACKALAVKNGYRTLNKYILSLLREAPYATQISAEELKELHTRLERAEYANQHEREETLRLMRENQELKHNLDELRTKIFSSLESKHD
jgi:hypothetical protein